MATQTEKAQLLRSLHQGPKILVLPNAWDALSARIFEVEGFPAIATTSAGVSYALGYADGECVPRDEMLAATARIARRVAVPVTADIEAGFGDSLDDLAESIRSVIEAGAVGVNIEDKIGGSDKLEDVRRQVERLHVVRETASSIGVPLVLNARTDVFLLGLNDFHAAVERLNAYRSAGADCLFVPGVTDREQIGAIVRAVHGPVNILATRGTPPIAELESLGVRRVSVGSGPCRAAAGLAQRIARELREQGTYESFLEGAISYPDLNRIMQ